MPRNSASVGFDTCTCVKQQRRNNLSKVSTQSLFVPWRAQLEPTSHCCAQHSGVTWPEILPIDVCEPHQTHLHRRQGWPPCPDRPGTCQQLHGSYTVGLKLEDLASASWLCATATACIPIRTWRLQGGHTVSPSKSTLSDWHYSVTSLYAHLACPVHPCDLQKCVPDTAGSHVA
jgi:hypothetical protein